MHRFYINFPIESKKILIQEERLVHQWRDVFRYNVGSQVVLFDGNGLEYEGVIGKINNREAEVEVVAERAGIIPEKKITLCISIIKKDKMEWVVEKATELGVSKIIPIISERSEKKNINLERLKKIAIEASEQCGRGDVPNISEIMSLEETLEKSENIVVCHNSPLSLPCDPSLITREGDQTPLSIFVGPEGGWSEKEIERFKDSNIKIFSLGNLVLRAETAAVVALSRMQ